MKNKFAYALITNQARPGRKHECFRLQQFAEGSDGEDPDTDEGGNEPEDKNHDEGSEGSESKGSGSKTYTDAEVNAIVERKMAEWSKKKDKEVNEAKKEAEKLAKMNAEQKRQYEYEKLQKENASKDEEIARLKKEALRGELSRSAAQIMKDQHNIIATQDMLDFVVGDDADQTNQRIEKLVGIILDDRKAQDKARATGKTPKSFGGSGNKLSEIDKRIAKYQ